MYANDEDKAPVSLPVQSFTMTFGAPVTDFAAAFEEQEPETSSEKVEYLYSSNKFVLNDVFGDNNDKMGWQRVRGGFKLYLSEGAKDRWYFNFELEMPTSYFTKMTTDGTIIYQWISFSDESNAQAAGAAACKLQAGSVKKTAAHQWDVAVNMSSQSADVIGKKWSKQNFATKIAADKTEYKAMYWNDIFALAASDRTDYSI